MDVTTTQVNAKTGKKTKSNIRSFVTHLEGAIDGAVLEARTLQTTHADRPIRAR